MNIRRALRIIRRQVIYGPFARRPLGRPNSLVSTRHFSAPTSIRSADHVPDAHPYWVTKQSSKPLAETRETRVAADNPYAAYDEMSRQNRGPFSRILDALPPQALTSDTFWTEERIRVMLRQREVVAGDVVRLLQILPGIMDSIAFDDAVRIVGRVVIWAGRVYALVLLPHIVDMFHDLVNRRSVNRPDEIDSRSLQTAYWDILDKLDAFYPSTLQKDKTILKTSPFIKAEALRLARHLFEKLDSLPSSSTARPHLVEEIVSDLLGGPLTSADLRDAVLRRMSMTEQPFTQGHYHKCMVQANREGKSDLAKSFLAKKRALQDDNTVNENLPDDLLLPKSQNWPDELIHVIEPYLRLAEGDDKMMRDRHMRPKSKVQLAWSNFLHRAAEDLWGISADQLAYLEGAVPDEAVCAAVMTPLIRGFARRERRKDAWRVWTGLEERQNDQTQWPDWDDKRKVYKGRFVDAVALATAADMCGKLFNLTTAVALVDHWAARLSRVKDGPLYPVTLDAQNLNVLLNLCRVEGKAGLAFRLFAVARERWRIFPDHVSLALLIDTARRHQVLHGHEIHWAIGARLTSLMSELARRRAGEFDNRSHALDVFGAQPREQASNDLLISVRKSWADEHGFVEPWEKACRLFHEVLFGNFPHLAKCKSPLQLTGVGPLQYITSYYGSRMVESPITPQMPLANARYHHLIPSEGTFHRYISLIGYFGRAAEIPLVFSWMRAVGVRPSFFCMNTALTFVADAQGPIRRIARWKQNGGSALVQDEELLRRWLTEWLGRRGKKFRGLKPRRETKTVPTAGDTLMRRRHLFRTSQKLTVSQ